MTGSGTLLPGLLLAAILGCFSPSPPVVFHTLHPLRMETPGTAHRALAVEVLPVRLPEVLQRPQMVLAQGSGRLTLSETHRWGNPLDRDMQRVLVENLALLLGSDAVVPSPEGARVGAAYRVQVEVQACAARAGDGLVLQATWMLIRTDSGRAVLIRRTVLRQPLPGTDPDALAEAHSDVLAALGRDIAAALLALPVTPP